jgi:hypothetical protein
MSLLLDVAIGLGVVFLLFSIAVSGINEWVAQASGRRGEFLRLGVMRLINDQAVFYRVLHHPLIGSLYRERAAQGKPPSYIEPKNFAVAIADVLIARASGTPSAHREPSTLNVAALQAAIRSPVLASSPVSTALAPILDRAQGDLEKALTDIEDWFNSGMDRVQGWYKGHANRALFVIGLLVAAAGNIDTIEIYHALNSSAPLRAAMTSAAQNITSTGKVGDITVQDSQARALTGDEIQSLRRETSSILAATTPSAWPIGYACLNVELQQSPAGATASGPGATAPGPGPMAPLNANTWKSCVQEFTTTVKTRSASAWLVKLVGWTLTAFAGTLGSTYWFQLLCKAIDIRGAGKKPVQDNTA